MPGWVYVIAPKLKVPSLPTVAVSLAGSGAFVSVAIRNLKVPNKLRIVASSPVVPYWEIVLPLMVLVPLIVAVAGFLE